MRTVTLVTGDKVVVTPGTGGGRDTISVERRPGAPGSVRIVTEGGDTYVYPDDALAYVAADRLDKRLFNVTALIAQGYDDARAPRLPLIITGGNSAALRRGAAALPGAETRRELPSVDGAAVAAERSQAADAWAALTAGGTGTSAQDTGSRRAAAAPPFTGGIGKIWLDGRTKAALADTTAQIGAPQVWESGDTGAGVKVAVLDTGVDPDHPDLKDRIVDTRSFVPDQDVPDRSGHGTHVASTVAGTGAASDGREKGVAPGADLVVGKVLGNRGEGQESWVIGGMEWAARTEHAKVVNMSLGSSEPSDGTDLMSQSLNALSAETGTLFVVSAGNSGRGATPYTIGSPAVADAALTVGAVGASDDLANFSSVGPRVGDEGLKPDLTAPGVDVLAARSQYAGQGEGPYTTMSGTSMAAPHVTGAAVLLAQRHPDWPAGRLKDALMSTSRPTPYLTAYQGGSGRVDVAAAVRARVTATGSAFRFLPWPNASTGPVRQEVTYTNSGDQPVTLRLAVEAGASDAGVFTLSADEVTVPAHGSSAVEVATDPAGLERGNHTAQVVARDADGAAVAHTVTGVGLEPERYDLAIGMKDRAGRPMGGWIHLKGALSRSTTAYEIPASGELTLRLPADTYTVVSYADVQGTHGPDSRGIALLSAPEVDLTTDRRVDLDASKAHQVRAVTPKPSTLVNTRLDFFRSFTSAEPGPDDYGAMRENVVVGRGYDSIWAQPTGAKVRHGSFVFATRLRAQQTPLDLSYDGTAIDDALAQEGSAVLPDGTSTLDAVFAGAGSPEDFAKTAVRGKVAVVRHSAEVAPSAQASAAKAAGARLLLVVNDGVGRLTEWYGEPDYSAPVDVPVVSVGKDEGEALIARIAAAREHRVRLRATAHPSPSYLYDLVKYHAGAVPTDVTYHADPDRLARIDVDFAQPQGMQAMERRTDFPAYEWSTGYSFGLAPMAPGRRTDWVTAGEHATWQQTASVTGWVGATNSPTSYRQGSVQRERWLGPVLRPCMSGSDTQVRDDTSLSLVVSGWCDSGAPHAGSAGTETMTTRTSLLQGGTTLLTTDSAYVNAFDLPAESLPYRIVVDTAGDPALSPYSSTTRTQWDFVSGAAKSGTVPLVQLDYGTDLDASGRAHRAGEVSITPSVLGVSAKDAVSSVRLEVSYDGGASWHRQDLKERQGTWRTTLHAPSSAAFVSLRTTATARAGGSVAQTVIRAFGLR